MIFRHGNAVKCVFILTSILFAAYCKAEDFSLVSPVPAWVSDVPLPVEDNHRQDEIQKGVYYLLIDSQVLAREGEEPHYFFHYAYHIVNQQGVEHNAQINIDYDPSYQRVTLHSVNVIRQGKTIDKIPSARMKIIQREKEMDDLIYNGRDTLNIILDDVRVGDTIEYRFSRVGMNPVYQDIFGFSHNLRWTVPVGKVSVRLLWEKAGSLQRQIVNSDLSLAERKTDNGVEYRIEGVDVPPLAVDRGTPNWFNPWGVIHFSELENWGEVVLWSEQLYHNVMMGDDTVDQIVADIKAQHSVVDDQIAAALRFVQDEIRYLGIELGQNSHKPSPAFTTLKRRYGDCKDKTVLLLTFLKKLGVEAYPALVNTELRQEIKTNLPSIQAFNHVLTYVKHQGQGYWLDPTRKYQYGPLATIYQPDYGYALVLEPGRRELEPMTSLPVKYGTAVKDSFVIPADPAKDVEYSTLSTYYGLNAETQRQRLADKGRTKLQTEFLEFYRKYYPDISSTQPVTIEDSTVNNSLRLKETYRIHDFWSFDREDNKSRTRFYANIVSHFLKSPKDTDREHPLRLDHPEMVEQAIKVQFGDNGWWFEDEEFTEDNEFFRFTNIVTFDEYARMLTLTYRYQSKTKFVPAEKYEDYVAYLSKTRMHQSYEIHRDFSAAIETNTASILEAISWRVLLAFYTAGYLLVLLLWRLERKRKPYSGDGFYYPVSLVKLTAMWVLTFGLYGMYWFYKNFSYIKEKEGSHIMPVARGIFLNFWYYELWKNLKKDSEQRFNQGCLPGSFMAVLLSIMFLCCVIASNDSTLTIPFLLISVLLVYPLANYILYINNQYTDAVSYHSAWGLRHYLLAVLSVPLCMLTLGSEVGVLPDESVIKGDKLLDYNVKYMQRHGILKSSDQIAYFYSDAFLFIHDDGNGFTQRHVFSYWRGEDGTLKHEVAEYDEIKDVLVSWEKGWGDNSTVTIVRHDDSEFVLYVSNSNRKDWVFINGLQKNWEKARLPELEGP